MKKPNQMVQMDILGPFYLANSAQKNYFISCEDDCSRKVSSECSERKRSVDVLDGTGRLHSRKWKTSQNTT